jgi:hypothetical protein
MKLLTEYESVNQKVLFGNNLLTTLMPGEKMASYFKDCNACTLVFQMKSIIKMQHHYITQSRKDSPSEMQC